MAKVYRFESVDGRGGYVSGALGKAGIITDFTRHPFPDADALLYKNCDHVRDLWSFNEYFFGFSSKKQLKKWFNAAERKLIAASKDIKLVIYYSSPKNFYRGDTQCLFIKNQAVKLGEVEVPL